MSQKQTMKNLMRTVIALLIILGALLMVLAVITVQKPRDGEVQVCLYAAADPIAAADAGCGKGRADHGGRCAAAWGSVCRCQDF